jgi:hypothetical protein
MSVNNPSGTVFSPMTGFLPGAQLPSIGTFQPGMTKPSSNVPQPSGTSSLVSGMLQPFPGKGPAIRSRAGARVPGVVIPVIPGPGQNPGSGK